MRTTAESTFGGGVKARAGTSMTTAQDMIAWTITDRRPYSDPPGWAQIRRATSF